MTDKTRLEHDIEEHEVAGLPLWSRLLVLLLLLIIGSLGLYVFQLTQEHASLKDELQLLRENSEMERDELLGSIRRLQMSPCDTGTEPEAGDSESPSD